MSEESNHASDETMLELSQFLNEDDAAVLKQKGPGRPKKSDKEDTKRVVVVTKKRVPSKRKLRQPDFYAPPLIWLTTKEKGMGRTEKSDKEDNECYPIKKKIGRPKKIRQQKKSYADTKHVEVEDGVVLKKKGSTKDKEETECSLITRKVGRPKKSAHATPKRGRPKKKSADITSSHNVEDSVVGKMKSPSILSRRQEWRAKKDEVGVRMGRPRKSADTAALVMVQKKGTIICPKKSDKEEAEHAPIKRKRGRPTKSADNTSPQNNVQDVTVKKKCPTVPSMTMAAIGSREWRAKRLKAGGKTCLEESETKSVKHDTSFDNDLSTHGGGTRGVGAENRKYIDCQTHLDRQLTNQQYEAEITKMQHILTSKGGTRDSLTTVYSTLINAKQFKQAEKIMTQLMAEIHAIRDIQNKVLAMQIKKNGK
jgi:ribosomal protein S6